jgi:hypothetical protein
MCGFIGTTRSELVKHYGHLHPGTIHFLEQALRNGEAYQNFDIGLYKKDQASRSMTIQSNPTECVICLRKVSRSNLPSHSALVHFKDQYLRDIVENQTFFQMAPGRCPHPGCSFAVQFQASSGFLAHRNIALIKHYLIHISVIDIVNKYKINIGL